MKGYCKICNKELPVNRIELVSRHGKCLEILCGEGSKPTTRTIMKTSDEVKKC